MGEQSTAILYLSISNALLWVIVLSLLGFKIHEIVKKHVRLKARVLDDSGRVREEYDLHNQKELLIGISTPANLVNIDFAGSQYAKTIEEDHAAFCRFGRDWYLFSRAKNGMVGLKRSGDDTVYKLRPDIPYQIRRGDIVFISYEKILIE